MTVSTRFATAAQEREERQDLAIAVEAVADRAFKSGAAETAEAVSRAIDRAASLEDARMIADSYERMLRGLPQALVIPRRLRIPLLGEIQIVRCRTHRGPQSQARRALQFLGQFRPNPQDGLKPPGLPWLVDSPWLSSRSWLLLPWLSPQ